MSFLLASAIVIAGCMFALWILSLRLKDASIVDSFWGPGYLVATLVAATFNPEPTGRMGVILVLVALWSLRLGGHIFFRNLGTGEDYRYQQMREEHGDRFPLVSLFTVFGFQGLLMWGISIPLQYAAASPVPSGLGLLEIAGIGVFAVGFVWEAVGDYQLKKFKENPDNSGKVLNSGLWGWTRHPNYFGEAVLWWGFWLVAFPVWPVPWLFYSPLAVGLLVRFVSGVPLLEEHMRKKEKYSDYLENVPIFFPRPPSND